MKNREVVYISVTVYKDKKTEVHETIHHVALENPYYIVLNNDRFTRLCKLKKEKHETIINCGNWYQINSSYFKDQISGYIYSDMGIEKARAILVNAFEDYIREVAWFDQNKNKIKEVRSVIYGLKRGE